MTYQIENLKKLSKLELGNGDRLVRIIAKGGKVENRVIESQGVIIPSLGINAIQLVLNNDAGKEYLLNSLYSIQDSIIRKLIANGKNAIFDQQIDIEQMLIAMQEANETQRFSKETIKKWFDGIMLQYLESALQAKGYGNQAEKLIKNYLESFSILAQRNPSMNASIKAGLVRCMELLPADQDDAVTVEIARRLSEVQEPSAMLAAL
jgi:hypothetical protein